MPEIGATLREARMRARLDVSEIEAQTKIRAKYLRALENEEWSLLPGPTFIKSFLRTYAQALGLDARALVEEYRLHHERPNDPAFDPIASTPTRQRQRQPRSGPSRAYVASVGVIGLVIVLLIVLLATGGGSSNKGAGTSTAARSKASHPRRHAASVAPAARTGTQPLVALSLKPTAEVYVCLIGDHGRS
jgi:cytoskeletal protein RodZ